MKVRRRRSQAAQEENVIRDHDDRRTGAWSRSVCLFQPTTRLNAMPSTAWVPASADCCLVASAVATPRMLCVSLKKVYSKTWRRQHKHWPTDYFSSHLSCRRGGASGKREPHRWARMSSRSWAAWTAWAHSESAFLDKWLIYLHVQFMFTSKLFYNTSRQIFYQPGRMIQLCGIKLLIIKLPPLQRCFYSGGCNG